MLTYQHVQATASRAGTAPHPLPRLHRRSVYRLVSVAAPDSPAAAAQPQTPPLLTTQARDTAASQTQTEMAEVATAAAITVQSTNQTQEDILEPQDTLLQSPPVSPEDPGSKIQRLSPRRDPGSTIHSTSRKQDRSTAVIRIWGTTSSRGGNRMAGAVVGRMGLPSSGHR